MYPLTADTITADTITDEQIRELWRAKLITSGERDLAIRAYRGEAGETLRREERQRCAEILNPTGGK